MINKSEERKNVLLALLIFVLIVMYKLYLFKMGRDSIRDSLTAVFGYVNLSDEKSIILNYASWMMPRLVAVIILGDYYRKELIVNSSLILVRASSRTKIIIRYMLNLLKNIFLVAVLEVIIVCIFSIIGGGNVSVNRLLVLEILSILLYIIMTVLLVNALSLFMKTTYTIACVIIIESIQLFVISANMYVGRFIPVYGILYERIGNNIKEAYYMVLNNIVWLSITIIATIVIFKRKKDII